MEHATTGREKLQAELTYLNCVRLYESLCVMLQVHDDAADIATDFSHGHTNIAIAYSLRAVKDTPTLEAIKHAFYFSGIAEQLYLWVESNATAILQTLPQSAELLHALLAEIAKKSILQRKIIEDYVAEKNFAASYQLSLYDNSSPFNEKLTEAIKLTLQQGKHVNASLGLVGILQHASSSFSEAFHFMHLRADEGFVNNGVYVGNVFALATLSQKLHSFSTKIDGLQLDFLLEPIERYLLSLRQKNFRGTWCYLNGCDFLGADLDDAAQVIRALDAKRFDGDVIEFITFLEQKIIESQSPAPTWIPPITPTDQTDYQQQLTNSLWGDTIDIEVVANTILLFEKLECLMDYSAPRRVLTDYIESTYSQLPTGELLPSRWYYSSLYPVYLICAQRKTPLSLELQSRFIDALPARQNADGAGETITTSTCQTRSVLNSQ